MQADIHPTYHPDAQAKCACGKSWKTGSTKPELNISICSSCHPFFTGQDKILDTRGQVERFKKRLEKSVARTTLKSSKTPRKSNKK